MQVTYMAWQHGSVSCYCVPMQVVDLVAFCADTFKPSRNAGSKYWQARLSSERGTVRTPRVPDTVRDKKPEPSSGAGRVDGVMFFSSLTTVFTDCKKMKEMAVQGKGPADMKQRAAKLTKEQVRLHATWVVWQHACLLHLR
jgi:hypothetical protein